MPKVAVIPVADYELTAVRDGIRQASALLGITSQLFAGAKVLVKPNLLAPSKPADAVCTHPTVVEAVIAEWLGESSAVLVGDSPGIGRCYAVAKRLGLDQVCSRQGAELVEFQPYRYVALTDGRMVKRLPLGKPVVDADILISCAKLKTHGLTGYTGALKNLFGCVYGKHKAELHLRLQNIAHFSEMLVDLYQTVAPQLSVIDGIVAMEGAGPRSGTPKRLGVIIVSEDAVAADAVACHLIGIDPMGVEPLRIAHERRVGCADLRQIQIVGGSVRDLQDSFQTVTGTSTSLGKVPPLIRGMLKSYLTAKPIVNHVLCQNCGVCVEHCPPKAISMDKQITIDYTNCIRCYCCQELCPHSAISLQLGPVGQLFQTIFR